MGRHRHIAWLVMLALAAWGSAAGMAGEVLYNGIVLPAAWPPTEQFAYPDPATPSYLTVPPAVIPIDVGRQLFVDDFLVQSTTLTRTHRLPTYYTGNPVLTPTMQWEWYTTPPSPYAMPFSDGVWYDPQDKIFKMWYLADGGWYRCYATSPDGLNWTKPNLGLYNQVWAQNNITVPHTPGDSSTTWLDLEETIPAKRYKRLLFNGGLYASCSPDGLTWSGLGTMQTWGGDRNTMFYNPFRKVWVMSLRFNDYSQLVPGSRCRLYKEMQTFNLPWSAPDPTKWLCADNQDARSAYDLPVELYNFDALPYESLFIGLFSVYQGFCGDSSTAAAQADLAAGRAKLNGVKVGYSRDGFHFSRQDRRYFMPYTNTKGDWSWGNVQSCNALLVVGDNLYFYASGRAGLGYAGTPPAPHGDSGGQTGVAILRRDGFASMDAGGTEGTLTTRPISFSGKHLFVNVAAPSGALRAEVLDQAGAVIAPFTKANCVAVTADKTLQRVQWNGAADLSSLAGQPVRIKFYLTDGSLYAFWVSPDLSGASYGFVGTGGPGFTSNKDTTGAASPVYGDGNGDGIFALADLNLMVDWLLVRTAAPATDTPVFTRCDVNGSGDLSLADLNLYVDRLLRRITKFPVEP
jgi:hypothetical protein